MPIRLGQLEIHAELNEIAGPAGRQRLEPQAVTVLELLAGEPDRVWSRDELLDRAWTGRVVSDATLTGVISRLRRALADAGVTDVVIETRSKRGYVLQHPVAPLVVDSGCRRKRARLAAGGVVALLLIAAITLFLPEDSGQRLATLDGVQLAFHIIRPDGETSNPVIWLKDNRPGEIRVSGERPLAIRFVPALTLDGLLRLRVEASSGAHWVGYDQAIGLDTESRLVLRGRASGSAYDIRFTASRLSQADLQEKPR